MFDQILKCFVPSKYKADTFCFVREGYMRCVGNG